MDNENYKHIDFSKWCPTCIYWDEEEYGEYSYPFRGRAYRTVSAGF